MQMRQLGTSDVRVSPIIFGAWAIGGWMWGGQEESDSIAAIQASIDAGATTIDTAAIYGMGYSEELVAKAVKGRRDRVQIATKCGMRWDAPASGEQGTDPWPNKDNAGKDVVVRKNSCPESMVLSSLEKIRSIKDPHGASFAQLAINWTVHEPGITAALVGARNAEQATHNAAALNFTLSDHERRQIGAAFDEIAVYQ